MKEYIKNHNTTIGSMRKVNDAEKILDTIYFIRKIIVILIAIISIIVTITITAQTGVMEMLVYTFVVIPISTAIVLLYCYVLHLFSKLVVTYIYDHKRIRIALERLVVLEDASISDNKTALSNVERDIMEDVEIEQGIVFKPEPIGEIKNETIVSFIKSKWEDDETMNND